MSTELTVGQPGARGSMSQSVERLKELLFDSEAQEMAELARRIDAVAEIDNRGRDELRQKLAQIFDRVGTSERFATNVASVLDQALRQAEVTQHAELSSAMAPLMLTTIKAELRNSQDEMVEALYPITGRLVKSYVASAIKDLSDQINRRLEQNPVMLRLQSLTTGRSVADLALAGTQDFKLQELYLIRRGSGELVAHWPQTGTRDRQQVMSGVLAAVNEFANEAFAANQSTLRQIDIGDSALYLRGSPLYLLAAKCSGTAPKGIEKELDDAFLAAVEMQHEISTQAASTANLKKEQEDLLGELGGHLEARIAEQKSELAQPAGAGALKTMLAIILLPLIGYLTWSWYTGYEKARVLDTARLIVSGTRDMQGYPAQFETSPLGSTLTISGLAPSQEAKAKILDRLSKVLTGTQIKDELAVVPGGNTVTNNVTMQVPDANPKLAEQITGQVTGQVAGKVAGQVAEEIGKQSAELRQQSADLKRAVTSLEVQMALMGVRRAADRADRRLKQAVADLDRTAKATEEPEKVIALKRITQGIEIAARDLTANRTVLNGSDGDAAKAAGPLVEITTRIEGLAGDIAKYMNGEAPQGAQPKKPAKPAADAATAVPLDAAAENLAAESERLAAMAATVALTGNGHGKPVATAAPAVELSARERLESYARAHAVFFGNRAEYRNPATADQTLREFAGLIRDAGILVRVVGYTDEAGAAGRNNAVALDRAKVVQQDLIARGVPENLLAVVGRTKVADLSPNPGPFSPNRRVEFELSFHGEGQP
jgi:outer membrane protein OmpA-like peptidoglycan-associated protein